ncbi:hypothetical protein MAE02_71470 [Microvirga aerophila]|uniref:Uncharacterized protein n=1 Tax=Microvirga aerophila TaxID=670291 RepID=A0A512C5H9_9HYPH|nr:hypothetical protein MAE02_71470 [Microvirga aerophila]
MERPADSSRSRLHGQDKRKPRLSNKHVFPFGLQGLSQGEVLHVGKAPPSRKMTFSA